MLKTLKGKGKRMYKVSAKDFEEYKREVLFFVKAFGITRWDISFAHTSKHTPVSYTHLTLPTILRV